MNRTIFIAFITFLLASGTAGAQATIPAQAFAEVIEALAANEDEALNFGRFTPGRNGGNLVISPDGLRSVSGTVMPAGGTYSPARFLVLGAAGSSFTIALPPEETILTHRESGNTMVVSNWISDPPPGDAANLADGSRLVSIGATLKIGNMEENPVGIYSGSFLLTFAYN